MDWRSDKPIPRAERLIFALDVPTPEAARAMAERLGDSVRFYKLGLELFMAGGYWELVDHLAAQGKKIFVDLKFFDVPATVAGAVRRLNGRGVELCTVHGNDSMLRAACEAREDVKVLAVTVLTSLDRGDLDDLGFQCDAKTLVLSRPARLGDGLRRHRLLGARGAGDPLSWVPSCWPSRRDTAR